MRTPSVFDSFTQAYVSLTADTYAGYEHETAPRGMKVRENLFASFTLIDPRDRLLYVPERKFNLAYVLAEILWYLSGSNSTEWIANYSAFWRDISDDGVTANSAYGARIFKPHFYQDSAILLPDPDREGWLRRLDMPEGWSQWEYVKQELTRDPDSRRAVIHIRMPQDSYLASKDVPCTLSIQFLLRDAKLHAIVQMRSNDLVLGTALDVPAFTFLQELMALELGVGLGRYHHTSNSLHVYERHYDMCERILAEQATLASHPMPPLPGRPPVAALDDLQARARLTDSPAELVRLGNEARDLGDPLWVDWAQVLIAHRARRIGDLDLERWFHEGLSLQCFRAIVLP